MGKLGILVVGIILIIGVLFIGYKMDTSSPKVQTKRTPKKKKTKAKREKNDEEIYDNVYNMSYELEDEEEYEDEEEAYEDEDEEEGFFSRSTEDEPTFNNDIDNELSFETSSTNDYMEVQEPVKNNYDFYEDVSVKSPYDVSYEEEMDIQDDVPEEDFAIEDTVEEVIPEPIIEEKVVEPPKKKRGRPKKVKEPVIEENIEPETEEDFSSTMIFDTDKLSNELEEIDNMDNIKINQDLDSRLDIFGAFGKSEAKVEPANPVEELTPEDYSDAVNIDDKINSLDDDIPKSNSPAKDVVEGPFKPAENEAESFMNELKRMQESAEVDDFEGFAVDTRSEDLRETHKKYTKKKPDPIMDNSQISFIPEEKKEDEVSSNEMDINFLAEMERNLKETQKQRMTRKNTNKKDEE